MARTSLLAVYLAVGCLLRIGWTSEAASNAAASPQRIQQTVERAIVYLQGESGLVEDARSVPPAIMYRWCCGR